MFVLCLLYQESNMERKWYEEEGNDSKVQNRPKEQTGQENKWRQKREILLFSETSRPALGLTQPPTQWYRGSVPELKRSGRDFDHSTPPCADVTNARGCTLCSSYNGITARRERETMCIFIIGT
jgi:hypothetical protein